MSLMQSVTHGKIHNRNISVTTYPARENCIIVEGELKDDRMVEVYTASGDKKPQGVVHHMVVRLLIGPPGLTIKDVEVEMLGHPRKECPETMKSLDMIIGMTIKSGFTAAVKKKIGGNKGCAHLTMLIVTMAPAVLQGYYANYAQKPMVDTSRNSKNALLSFLVDTCFVWRKEGPLMRETVESMKKEEL